MLDRLRSLLIVRIIIIIIIIGGCIIIIITPRGPIPIGPGDPEPIGPQGRLARMAAFVGMMAGLVGLGSELSQVGKNVQ